MLFLSSHCKSVCEWSMRATSEAQHWSVGRPCARCSKLYSAGWLPALYGILPVQFWETGQLLHMPCSHPFCSCLSNSGICLIRYDKYDCCLHKWPSQVIWVSSVESFIFITATSSWKHWTRSRIMPTKLELWHLTNIASYEKLAAGQQDTTLYLWHDTLNGVRLHVVMLVNPYMSSLSVCSINTIPSPSPE